MRMPGLSAEAALAGSSGHHRTGNRGGDAERGIGPVRPAGLGDIITIDNGNRCVPIFEAVCVNNPNFPHPYCYRIYGCLPV